MTDVDRAPSIDDRSRDAETALRKLGYARVAPGRRVPEPGASFWVQESGVPRRTFPVFVPPHERSALVERIDRWLERATAPGAPRRAIFVAPSDSAAQEAWDRLARTGRAAVEHDVSILVVPSETSPEQAGHFALRRASPTEVLRLATGVVVGLFRRAQDDDGSGAIDFAELLQMLRGRFGIDVHRSLGVRTDEDALYVLYQLAQRDSYAPGEAGSNLHLLVLKPTGPAARVPWFAG
jgi:hypothetical protein